MPGWADPGITPTISAPAAAGPRPGVDTLPHHGVAAWSSAQELDQEADLALRLYPVLNLRRDRSGRCLSPRPRPGEVRFGLGTGAGLARPAADPRGRLRDGAPGEGRPASSLQSKARSCARRARPSVAPPGHKVGNPQWNRCGGPVRRRRGPMRPAETAVGGGHGDCGGRTAQQPSRRPRLDGSRRSSAPRRDPTERRSPCRCVETACTSECPVPGTAPLGDWRDSSAGSTSGTNRQRRRAASGVACPGTWPGRRPSARPRHSGCARRCAPRRCWPIGAPASRRRRQSIH